MECQGVFHLLEGGMNKQLKLEFIRVNPNISLPYVFMTQLYSTVCNYKKYWVVCENVADWNPKELFKQIKVSMSIPTMRAYTNEFMDINIITNWKKIAMI